MKVYYVNSGLQGCYYVRCLLPLQANGWDGDKTSIREHTRTPENKTQAAKDADVVVFHRPDDPKKLALAKLLKSMGKKIVFDNDDTLKDDGGFKFNEYLNKERFEKGMATLNQTIDDFIKIADLVTCSTEFLAKEYRLLNQNVIVLPNCVDPFEYDEPLLNETDVVRIGITGSVAITSDMEVLKPIVEKYHNDKRVQLVLFSMPPGTQDKVVRELYSEEYKFWENVNVEWQTFVPHQDYISTLNELRLDMMIIPRADNLFNRCKSNLKFLEASMLEIPVIAQGFSTGDSPYQQNPEDAKRMIIVTPGLEAVDSGDGWKTDELSLWVHAIEKLINNKELRRSMGINARKYVESEYNIEKHAQRWVDAYKTICQK